MRFVLFALLLIIGLSSKAQIRTAHVYVALCDNEHQGIVPVPATLGNGKDPVTNLYWGAAYGVKSYFRTRAQSWEIVDVPESNDPFILERMLFRHKSDSVYLLAEAYDGEQIQDCIEDFLLASNGQRPVVVEDHGLSLSFGGGADVLAYVGHDGLMDFGVDLQYHSNETEKKDVMILACYSMRYFAPEIQKAGANPVLWTTHLMAPEAYTLEAALDGWIKNESGTLIEERAAQAYHKYQNCGINGARNLFVSGF
jgi:hypothetical protein